MEENICSIPLYATACIYVCKYNIFKLYVKNYAQRCTFGIDTIPIPILLYKVIRSFKNNLKLLHRVGNKIHYNFLISVLFFKQTNCPKSVLLNDVKQWIIIIKKKYNSESTINKYNYVRVPCIIWQKSFSFRFTGNRFGKLWNGYQRFTLTVLNKFGCYNLRNETMKDTKIIAYTLSVRV